MAQGLALGEARVVRNGPLVFTGPLLAGLGPQAAILNCLGYSIGSWLMCRLLLRRPARRPHRR